jgi:hypothetical protein
MANADIEKKKQQLYNILKKGCTKEVLNELRDLAHSITAPVPAGYDQGHTMEDINAITRNIHITLQTEEMFNACISAEESSKSAKESCTIAKRSCRWAAMAAIASLISAIVALIILFATK